MELRRRPAAQLRRLLEVKALTQGALGVRAWPLLRGSQSRERIKSWLGGHWPGPELAEDVAAALEVDSSTFYLDLDLVALPPGPGPAVPCDVCGDCGDDCAACGATS